MVYFVVCFAEIDIMRCADGSFSCVAVGDQGVVKGLLLRFVIYTVGVLVGGGPYGSLNLARPTWWESKSGPAPIACGGFTT